MRTTIAECGRKIWVAANAWKIIVEAQTPIELSSEEARQLAAALVIHADSFDREHRERIAQFGA